MRSFLGVPIVAQDEVIGAFYLTEKETGRRSAPRTEALIELLAAHAAIAITNARLYERSRELSIVSERNRLALELHDVVSQKLFSLVLTAEAAATQLDRDPRGRARQQVERLGELAREALEELRSLIFGLRPPELERDGLEGALRKEVEMLRARARRRDRARSCRWRTATAATTPATSRSCGSSTRRSTTRSATPAPGTFAVRARDRRALGRGHRRRRRVRARRAGAALPPPRPDLDGGARPRARRPARDPLGARGGTTVRLKVPADE